MNSSTTRTLAMTAAALVLTAFGCAAPGADEAPTTDDDSLEPAQVVSSNGWTGDSWGFSNEAGTAFQAGATFTGPANSSRKIGVCPLQQFGAGTGKACTTVADCSASPTTLPSGGFRYCAAPNNTGTKRCFYRPGPQSLCAGSPATGAPVTTDASGYAFLQANDVGASAGTKWISYACFEGCTATDPSSSSTVTVMASCQWVNGMQICQ